MILKSAISDLFPNPKKIIAHEMYTIWRKEIIICSNSFVSIYYARKWAVQQLCNKMIFPYVAMTPYDLRHVISMLSKIQCLLQFWDLLYNNGHRIALLSLCSYYSTLSMEIVWHMSYKLGPMTMIITHFPWVLPH